MARPDLTNKIFGSWLALRKLGDHWLCRCSCGIERAVYEWDLRSGRSKQCARCNSYRHGHRIKGIKSPTYTTWVCMKRRCADPSFKDYDRYGGSGIRFCERWADFQNFLNDMGERPKGKILDRIKSTGDYDPGNCRWVTPKESAANRRPYGTVKPKQHPSNP